MYEAADTQLNNQLKTTDSFLREDYPVIVPLVRKLCHLLATKNVLYCHWKSNNALDRSASGDNDLDLLVSRTDASRFAEILDRLGFKQAKAIPKKQVPGVLDYIGYDSEADRLIHVHAHYQLTLGHDMTKNYRLPIERPYLASAVQGTLFKVPSPEFECIVFVIRMVLKHSTWDTILGREGTLNAAERRELVYLQERINQERVREILHQHLPFLPIQIFDNCVQALHPETSIWRRIRAGHQLQEVLNPFARRSLMADTILKISRRVEVAIRRRTIGYSPKYRLEVGGALIAIVGGDGAGKSTAVDMLLAWLASYFEATCVHLGKPSWSLTTRTVRGFLKIGSALGLYPAESSFYSTLEEESLVSPGYPWLLREVCRARDRHGVYLKARRITANGGLVICDRYTVPEIQIMDGPLTEQFVEQMAVGPQADRFLSPRKSHRLTRLLVKLEESYYQQIAPPEILIVLLLEPAVAVKRRHDEDSVAVRKRSSAVWELDWAQTDAHVVDTGRSKSAVAAQLKALVWSEL